MAKAKSPYSNRPARTFWKTGVVGQEPGVIEGLYEKRFDITPAMKVGTAGSCFAQHIATNLRLRGFNVLDMEPAPERISDDLAKSYGYRLYSARYGNIYTARQLVQLLKECLGEFEPQDAIWEKDGRYYDALRPSVEPEGLESPEEVTVHRRHHLTQVKAMIEALDLFVFTFGLTEAWVHRASGTVYPTAPGTIAGEYDPDVYVFQNFGVSEVLADFVEARDVIKRIRPDAKFLVTVSPVPLNATATDDHVLAATVYSKSVLRAVAGELKARFDDVDYFPSYEIISTPFLGANFFEDDRRSVAADGVATVMATFFGVHDPNGAPLSRRNLRQLRRAGPEAADQARKRALRRERLAARAEAEKASPAEASPGRRRGRGRAKSADQVVCEEMLLDAFAEKTKGS